jgi:hypothetical protein
MMRFTDGQSLEPAQQGIGVDGKVVRGVNDTGGKQPRLA